MTVLAVALIAAGLVGFALVLRHEIRATRPADDYFAEDELLDPHRDWIEQQELDRLVNTAVLDAYRTSQQEARP